MINNPRPRANTLVAPQPPEILAPAGDMPAALAALAAGADALYLGLKHFSARMQAENFATAELARLVDLAHSEGRRIYVAMNTLLRPGEAQKAYRLIKRLACDARPDALIIQDPGLMALARQAYFDGELHFSTLANVTHQKALLAARSLGAVRVILPRELSLDEIALMNAACPPDMALEIFVHGALCYCVSGRCWWSGYMGGKSGLRGRCVQPCRRVYEQKGRKGRFFSCQDLSLDVATRELLGFEHLRSWKIEGRKKGPHYVYHVSRAYRLLRDAPDSQEARREALDLLALSLGRPGSRSLFFDLGAPSPAAANKNAQTSSGLLCAAVLKDPDQRPLVRPRMSLLPGDLLRVGYEDEPWHATVRLASAAAEGKDLLLALPRGKRPKAGTPVFLIDRKDAELKKVLAAWTARLNARPKPRACSDVAGQLPAVPVPCKGQGKGKMPDIRLGASLPHGREAKKGLAPGTIRGLWLSPAPLREVSKTLFGRISWWLPPVIWPGEEEVWQRLLRMAFVRGARHFVCNALWQEALFPDKTGLSLTAGPFCNLAGAFALDAAHRLGFGAALISPELGAEDILALPGASSLPLGLTLSGYWPVGLTRHQPGQVKQKEAFVSPKGENFWLRRYGGNVWIYPGWPMDLTAHRPALERAGYRFFVHMDEHPPKGMEQAARPGEFNWHVGML
ncbi:U32 family peptidase [Desulfovibrio sp. OttesenSCG-928-M14]|nr:U32 family peptidase [Desulfovibrio sp. OttesenSCG-928-M14]